MKRLRRTQNDPIGVFVTGEYGEKTKRPHWHAILFNYYPRDAYLFRTTDRRDRVYRSESLETIWGKGLCEIGSVTFESAGYTARYASKKLVHGHDDQHDFQPISKKSSKHAIGKAWLEKNWEDIFNHGRVIIDGKDIGSIPRYYEKWLKKHKPTEWLAYVTRVKLQKTEAAALRADAEQTKWLEYAHAQRDQGASTPLTLAEIRDEITKEKFKQLQNHLKLK